MKNIFTDYLEKQGWTEVELLTYRKANTPFELFFDTSNQVEVYKEGKRVNNVYLKNLHDLIELIETLNK